MPTGRGLFTGFEAYVTATEDDYRTALTSGIVVLDTNALLNLYRYTDEPREDLLRVLEAVGESLWIPHQAVAEFWTNRERVLRDRPRDAQDVTTRLQKNLDSSTEAIATWANRLALREEVHERLLSTLQDAYDEVVEQIGEEAASSWWPEARDTGRDPVVARLAMILDGHVGPPLEQTEHTQAVEEADRRRRLQLPPGFLDDGPGDYLIWEQTLREAEATSKPVLFVTGDMKKDWWREEGGEKRGPRVELAVELRDRANVPLLMIRPARLLEIAMQVLNVEVHERSVRVAQRLDEIPHGRGAARRLIVEGKYEEAEAIFSRKISAHPENSTLYIGRAQARYGLGRIDDAFADLDTAERLQPDRQDTAAIRAAMLAGSFAPRADVLAQAEVALFRERIRNGDISGARAALDDAVEHGLQNPAYLCINRATLHLAEGNAAAAIEVLRTERPQYLGPYVRVIVDVLELIAEIELSGVVPEVSRLDASLHACGRFDYRAGSLEWLRAALEKQGTFTEALANVYDYLDHYEPPPRQRSRTWRMPEETD